MIGLPEDTIQIQVVSHFLNLEEKRGDFTFYAVAGGSVRVPPHIGKRLKTMGVRAGVSDLVFCLENGKTVFIELKSMEGSLSPAQKKFDQIVTGLGFSSYCVKGSTGGEVIRRISDILGFA